MIFEHLAISTAEFGLGFSFLKLLGYFEIEVQFLKWNFKFSWDWRDLKGFG